MKWSDLRYVSDIKEGSNAKEAFLADYLPFGCVAVGTSRAPVRASLADRLVSVGRLPPLRRASQAALAIDRTSRPASSFPKTYPFSVAVMNSLRTALCSRTAPNSKQTNKPEIGCLTRPNQHHLPMETKRQGVNIIKH